MIHLKQKEMCCAFKMMPQASFQGQGWAISRVSLRDLYRTLYIYYISKHVMLKCEK